MAIKLTTPIQASIKNALNKNLRELYKYTVNANTRIAELSTAITNLNNKLNALLAALRSAGVVNNG